MRPQSRTGTCGVVVLVLGTSLLIAPAQAQTTWYVDDNAPNDPGPGDPNVSDPNEDGSLARPFDAIQEGISAATSGDEVVILQGTYTGNGNRDLDYGGRAITVRSTDPNDPGVVAATVIDCQADANDPHRGFDFHSGEDANSVLAGLTIMNGYADVGGGIACDWSSPAITNCVFRGNRSYGETGGTGGGGLFCSIMTDLVISNCSFLGNSASAGSNTSTGGAIAAAGEMAFELESSTLTLWNCTFSGNSAGESGGAVTGYFCNLAVNACTFSGNSADMGGDIFNLPLLLFGPSYLLIDGSIFWGSTSTFRASQVYQVAPGILGISYCDIQGGLSGVLYDETTVLYLDPNTIVDVDPLLTFDGHLRAGSPCINGSDPNFVPNPSVPTDIDGDDRVAGGRLDIGADEFVDTDADGLPDWWEATYFDPNTGADPNTDSDGDGLTNLQEYEQYSSHPNTPPIYVDNDASNDPGPDDPNVSDPNEDGSVAHPFDAIQEALDAAASGNTALVLPGTYAGPLNKNLDYDGKIVVVRSQSGPTVTTIDCGGDGRAVKYESMGGGFVVLEGFTITGGNADLGGAIRSERARPLLRNCVLAGNTASSQGGGVYLYGCNPTVNDLVIGSNTAGPNQPDGGLISYSSVYLEGNLILDAGRLDVFRSVFYGPGTISLDHGGTLKVTGGPGDPPLVLRNNIEGPGVIEIDLGQQLTIAGDAVVDLDREPGVNPGGQILINGALLAQDNAIIRNATITVFEAEFDPNTQIVNNNIALLEASAGYGGQFFVRGNAAVRDNAITSEGDRYLDLDPDPASPNRPTITNNEITVIIKQGTLGSEGTLLELRAHDYDCGGPNNPYCESGAFPVQASSLGFPNDPSENWVLEELRIDPSAKLNLTNRQGFVFQDPNDPNAETVYVKKVKLCENAVLNTALQTLYYQTLVDQNDVEIVRDPDQPNGPFANGSRIVDIPMLGFSLGIIAMEDDTEFDVRVRKRLRDPNDEQPSGPPYKEGAIERVDDPTHGGVMEMRTRAPGSDSASSVAAVGAFARAAEDEIAVIFEYLFRQNPSGDAYLTVYLCDRHDPDANAVAVAHVYPPAFDRAGAIGSDEFAVFNASVPRGDFNFTRGTYVKIELHGTDAVCWIDNWDPYIECDNECANMDGVEGVTETDYLLLLVAATGQDLASQWCADVTGDGYLDITDLLSWDAFFSEALNLCPTPPPPLAGSEAGRKAASFSMGSSFGGGMGDVLVIAGKSGDPNDNQDDFLYTMDPNDDYAGQKQSPTCPGNQCYTGNGRLLTDSAGTLYQVHGLLGLIHRESGQPIIGPDHTLTYGDSDVWVGIADEDGLPLTDAVFDRTDPNYVYVVPVMVHRPGAAGDPYKAVAKLEILGDPNDGNYDVVGLYGKDPNNEPNSSVEEINGSVTLETDVWQVREVDVDGYGNLFVLSAQAWNDNDWVLIYDETLGNASEVRVLVSGVVEAPTALHVSSDDTTLYLASAKNDPDANSTQIYRFTINRSGPTATGLAYLDSVEITNMRHVTAITENPATGTLYVMGLMAPTFDPNDGNPVAGTPIFTWPTMAMIPDDANGPVAATEISSEDPNHDLALPLSAVFIPPCMGHTLTVMVNQADDGTVTVDPDLACYEPNTPVTLTAEPMGGRKFQKWRIWDPNYPDDLRGSQARVDTNNPIGIVMDGDYKVKAFFKCGGGVEDALPLLTVGVVLCAIASRRIRKRR